MPRSRKLKQKSSKHKSEPNSAVKNTIQQQSIAISTFDYKGDKRELYNGLKQISQNSKSLKCAFCKRDDHKESECLKKEEMKYRNAYCHYCEEYGHFEDTCLLAEEAAREESEFDYQVCSRKKNSKKKIKDYNATKVTKMPQKVENISSDGNDDLEKYCRYCQEYSHREVDCIFYQEAAIEFNISASVRNDKVNGTIFSKLEVCNYCNGLDHTITDCKQKRLDDLGSELCRICKDHGHSFKACPTVYESDKEQTNDFKNNNGAIKQMNKTPKTKKTFKSLKFCNFCNEAEHSESECTEKTQYDYMSKYCDNCEKRGHSVDMCPLLDQSSKEQNSYDYKGKKENKFSASNVSSSDTLQDFIESKYLEYSQKVGNNNDVKRYCSHCQSDHHYEHKCPLFQKIGQKQSFGTIMQNPKLTNGISKICTASKYTDSDNLDNEALQRSQYEYYNKRCHFCKEYGHFEDACPAMPKPIDSQNKTGTKKKSKQASKSNVALKHVFCSFCNVCDHNESECVEKLQCDYVSKYCSHCNEYGHLEDNCQFYDQALINCQKQNHKDVIGEECKALKNKATSKENLKTVKRCEICEQTGHDEATCYVKEQSIYLSKYCTCCEENGHYEDDCPLFKKFFPKYTPSPKKNHTSALNKTSNYKSDKVCMKRICSIHFSCENCHGIYSDERYKDSEYPKLNTTVSGNTSVRKKFDEEKVRYCVLCGCKGLLEVCFLNEENAYC